MLKEVKSAVDFLTNVMRHGSKEVVIPEANVAVFATNLEEILCLNYRGHWCPDTPLKGSGYRCIRINHSLDPILAKAGELSGIPCLSQAFPKELTVWIDPCDVSYRFGENGSIATLDLKDRPMDYSNSGGEDSDIMSDSSDDTCH